MLTKKLVTLLITVVAIGFAQQPKADAFGLNLSSDGPYIHYLRPNIEYTQRWGNWLGLHQQRGYIMTSQESHSRNMIVAGSAQLINFTKFFSNTRQTLNPKLEVIIAKLFKSDTLALGGGAIYQAPKGEFKYLPGDLTAELFVTPKLTTFSSGSEYLWGFSLQADFPLPENNQLNIGYRNYKATMEVQGHQSVEQGLYIGLTTLF